MDKLLFFSLLSAVLFSGSVYGTLRSEKGPENFFVFTFSGIIALLLVFGVCGRLLWGVYAVIALAMLLWILSLLRFAATVREGKVKVFLRRFFSPGAVLFVLMLGLLLFINYGRLVSGFDEFTHWADCVKSMIFLDDFITNPASDAWYPSYPPGMALLQYFFEKLYIITGGSFSEWLLYYAYQLLFFSLLLPFAPKSWSEKPLPLAAGLAMTVLLPFMMYAGVLNAYGTLYIDPFLGIVLGCALAMCFGAEKTDFWRCAYVYCCAMLLVLAKASGMLLAVFVAAAFMLPVWRGREATAPKAKKSIAMAAAVLLPFLLWFAERSSSGINQSFSSKENRFSFPLLMRLFAHEEESFMQDAFDLVFHDLFRFEYDSLFFHVPLWLLLIIFAALLVYLRRSFAVHAPETAAASPAMPAIALVETVIFILGVCFSIVFTFNEEDALGSNSQFRYLCTVYQALALTVFLLLQELWRRHRKPGLPGLVCALLFVWLLPWPTVQSELSRASVERTVSDRYQFVATIENVQYTLEEPSRIYVVGQNRYDPNYLQLRFGMRPHTVQGRRQWEELWEKPNEKNVHTLSADEWMDTLVEDYDYVVIFDFDDYFAEKYSGLFSEGSRIESAAVYAVDAQRRLLVKNS